MKTVKEFRDSGLVFVRGDECYRIETDTTFLNDWHRCVNTDNDNFNECLITKFAWRDNTGEPPKFKGWVQVELTDGKHDYGLTSDFDWRKSVPLPSIKKWRPVLETQPVQTFKPGDKVDTPHNGLCEMILNPDGSGWCVVKDMKGLWQAVKYKDLKPYNPQLTELTELTGSVDIARKIIAAGFKK